MDSDLAADKQLKDMSCLLWKRYIFQEVNVWQLHEAIAYSRRRNPATGPLRVCSTGQYHLINLTLSDQPCWLDVGYSLVLALSPH